MKERLLLFLKHLKIGQNKFEEIAGLSTGFVNTLKDNLTLKNLNRIEKAYPELNMNWFKTGEGEMLKYEPPDTSKVKFYDPENVPVGRRLIPLYDDVSTIGGNLPVGYSAKMQPDSHVSEWIDPGDWFKSQTAAIRHYEDSMVEYPPGCILALKEVFDRKMIVPGKDYVIETQEYRITKKVQFAEDPEYIRVHSTNTERYEDGTLIHQPFNIHIDSQIARIFEVLGYVVKKGGGTIVYSNK